VVSFIEFLKGNRTEHGSTWVWSVEEGTYILALGCSHGGGFVFFGGKSGAELRVAQTPSISGLRLAFPNHRNEQGHRESY
jgi:hypothetical protein